MNIYTARKFIEESNVEGSDFRQALLTLFDKIEEIESKMGDIKNEVGNRDRRND